LNSNGAQPILSLLHKRRQTASIDVDDLPRARTGSSVNWSGQEITETPRVLLPIGDSVDVDAKYPNAKTDWSKYTVKDLKHFLFQRCLPVSGNKPNLIERLQCFDREKFVRLFSAMSATKQESLSEIFASVDASTSKIILNENFFGHSIDSEMFKTLSQASSEPMSSTILQSIINSFNCSDNDVCSNNEYRKQTRITSLDFFGKFTRSIDDENIKSILDEELEDCSLWSLEKFITPIQYIKDSCVQYSFISVNPSSKTCKYFTSGDEDSTM
jgi:hypothetical protein